MSIENNLASQPAIDAAEDAGQVAVFPHLNQLQIDIDSAASYATYTANLETFQRHFRTVEIIETPSKSGGDNKHITLTLEKNLRSNEERILLQACLGSDGIRELLSYVRVLTRDANPTLFFEPKDETHV